MIVVMLMYIWRIWLYMAYGSERTEPLLAVETSLTR